MDKRFIDSENEFKVYQAMLNDLGIKLDSNSAVLEFGCGSGGMVYQFRKIGLRAFGVDILQIASEAEQLCRKEKLSRVQENVFHHLDINNYKFPFEDNTFDFIFSDQVFEHVQNFDEAIREIYRVLKPGGSSLHFFPSKYRMIEGHVYVPYASIFQGYPYLLFWAFLGIRNEYQKGLDFREVAKINAEYLRTGTNYPSPSQVRKHFANAFGNVYYVEDVLINNTPGRLRHLKALAKRFPFIRLLVRYLKEQAIFVKKS